MTRPITLAQAVKNVMKAFPGTEIYREHETGMGQALPRPKKKKAPRT